MGTTLRNPQHYPGMKVRGARRRRLAPWQRLRGNLAAWEVSAARAADSFAKLSAILGPVIPRTPEVQARLAAYYDGRGSITGEDRS